MRNAWKQRLDNMFRAERGSGRVSAYRECMAIVGAALSETTDKETLANVDHAIRTLLVETLRAQQQVEDSINDTRTTVGTAEAQAGESSDAFEYVDWEADPPF